MIPFQKQHLVFLAVLTGILFFIPRAREDSSSSTSIPVTHAEAVATSSQFIPTPETYEYLEITESCDHSFKGLCIPAYAGPGTQYEKVTELRNGMIFVIKSTEVIDNETWYRVYFNEWLRHPDRVHGDWYIPAVAGRVVTDTGEQHLGTSTVATSKKILVDLSDHMIYAYDEDVLFMRTKVSTGVETNPTPVGTYSVYKKMPSRYMQGPIEGVTDVPFDLPGVPWNMYFTEDGAVIHGSYWHALYGTEQSSGCINLPPELSKILYDWAPVGTPVIIQE